MLTLAIDVGRTEIRASVYAVHFDDESDALPFAVAEQPLARFADAAPAISIDGRADFAELFSRIEAAVEGCLDALAASEARNIAAIGINVFSTNFVGVGADGAPATPVFTSESTAVNDDTFALALKKGIAESGIEGGVAALEERTGSRMHQSFVASQLGARLASDPAAFSAVRSWQTVATLLRARWRGGKTGAISCSEASTTGLLNWRTRDWDADLVALIKLDPNALPPIATLGGDEWGATLCSSYAERWPRLAEARLLLGCADCAAACVNEGAAHSGAISLELGASGAARIVLDAQTMAAHPSWRVPSGLTCHYVGDSRLALGGAIADVGSLREWSLATLCGSAGDAAQLAGRRAALGAEADALDESDAESRALTVLPFLHGERGPEWWALAKGVTIDGATSATRPAHIVRAATEAALFRASLVVEQIDEHVLAVLARLEESPSSLRAPTPASSEGGGAALFAGEGDRAAALSAHPDGLALESGHRQRVVEVSGGVVAESRVNCQVVSDILARPVRRGARNAASVGVVVLLVETLLAARDDATATRVPRRAAPADGPAVPARRHELRKGIRAPAFHLRAAAVDAGGSGGEGEGAASAATLFEPVTSYTGAVAAQQRLYRRVYRPDLAPPGRVSRAASKAKKAADAAASKVWRLAKEETADSVSIASDAAAIVKGKVAKGVGLLKRAAGLNPRIADESTSSLFELGVTQVDVCFDKIATVLRDMVRGLSGGCITERMDDIAGVMRTWKLSGP